MAPSKPSKPSPAVNEAAIAKALGSRKPKTRKGRKILQDRESKIVEDPKTMLIMKGNRASNVVMSLLRDLHRLRNPLSVLYTREHDFHPFEDAGKLEHLCNKFDHGLFAFGSSSKKRPCRLILGRLFHKAVLDMQELRVENFKPIASFASFKRDAIAGSKPLLLFQGSVFETDERLKRVKSLFLDFFAGAKPERIVLDGVEHVVVLSASETSVPATAAAGASAAAAAPGSGEPTISFRRFAIVTSKSGSRMPRVELQEVGPSFDIGLDRVKEPDRDMWKKAIKTPKGAKPKKVKNIKTDSLGKTNATIHLGKQDFDQIHTVHHGKAKEKKLQADLEQARKKRRRVAAVGGGDKPAAE
mmetsp:Transcript_6584/g.18828  ORF Transcript_6584/g.18828 Transcript_6584/m.18828 type:complete len:357 (+) Transcript_6584:96-1166(+)